MSGGEEVVTVSLELTVTREKEVARLLKRLRPGWRRSDIILWQVLCSTAGAVQCCRYFAILHVLLSIAGTLQYCRYFAVLQDLCSTAGTLQYCRYFAVLQVL